MDKKIEERLMGIVEPLLKNGRGGDWEHTLRTIKYARYLLQHEEGEEEIVIPTLYLHDIGWSQVNLEDFLNAPTAQKVGTKSALLHMKYGADLAKGILKKLGFNHELNQRIISIIAIHDEPEKVFAMKDPSATLVVEADRLDRYGPGSLMRFSDMFGSTYLMDENRKEVIEHLRKGFKVWFKTQTARALAEKMAREQNLLD